MEINKHNSVGQLATHCTNYTISTLHKIGCRMGWGFGQKWGSTSAVWLVLYKFHFHALDNYSILCFYTLLSLTDFIPWVCLFSRDYVCFCGCVYICGLA